MKTKFNNRRRFLKTGLALSLLGHLPQRPAFSHYAHNDLVLPQQLQGIVDDLYGPDCSHIKLTERFKIHLPDIAENNAVVSMRVEGPKNEVSSFALLAAVNPEPLLCHCLLSEHTDVSVAVRGKVLRSTDIYLVAQTRSGLIGAKRHVKYAIGCGGV